MGSGLGGSVVYFWNHRKGRALPNSNREMTYFSLFLAWNSGRLYKILQPDCWVIWTLLCFTVYMSQCLSLKTSYTFCFLFPIRFFVVEDHILHATQGLVTRPFTDELWNMALSKIIAVLRTHSVGIHTQTCLQTVCCTGYTSNSVLTFKIPLLYYHKQMPNPHLTPLGLCAKFFWTNFIWVYLLGAPFTILRVPAQKVQ